MIRDIFIFILIFFSAWINKSFPALDLCLGFVSYYYLFKICLTYFSITTTSYDKLSFVLNRYHLLLIIHGFMFILLLFYIEFDFFKQQGDWYGYHSFATSVANHLKDPLNSILIGAQDAKAYIFLIGFIYYIFNDSIILAVSINVFFVVTSSLILYLLIEKIFNHKVAKYALYLSAIYPALFLYEINLWKECFVFFLYISSLFITYKISKENKIRDILIGVLLAITLFNVRFFLLAPIILYIFYHYVIINFRLKHLTSMLVAAIVVAFLYFNQESNFQIETGTFNDYFFGSGISMLDRQGESFNYQIVSTNPYEFGTLILKHWKYYIKRIPLFYSNVWTYSRIYYVPFLSEKYTTTENWLFNILSYMNTLIVWIFLFVSLWGLKKMIIDLRTSTAIIWIPILTVPFIVSVFAHNQRYIFVLIYSTIPCIAYGISYCQNLKGYLFISGLLIITLIALVNLSLPIALSIIGVSLIFVFKKYLLFQKV